MATITSLSFVITSSYDGAGMRRARRDMDAMGGSTKSLHSILTPFNDSLRTTSVLALGLGPALIPAAAGAAALAGGLAAATTAAGAAAGVFGVALAGSIERTINATKAAKDGLKRQKDILATSIPGTKAYAAQLKKVHEAERVLTETLANLSPAQRKFSKSVDGMSSSWSSFLTATEKDTLTPASIAMGAVSRNMGKFVPIVKAVSPLVTQVAKDFAKWMDGRGLDRFIGLVMKYGVPALADFIRMGKSVITVLGQGFRDFLPLGMKIVKALANGAEELKGWASGGGFQRFIDKVTDNAPALRDIFKNLVVILGSVAGSMDDTSESSLTVVGILTDLLALLSPEMITAITYAWLGWNLALEAYALYCTAAAAASLLLATATSPFMLLIAGAALTVLAVVAALAALAAGIYFLVKYWDEVAGAFVTAWDATWSFVKDVALIVWAALRDGWAWFMEWFSATWPGVWEETKAVWSAFTGWLSSTWDSVWGGLLTGWQAFSDPFIQSWNTVWPELKLSVQNIWGFLSAAWSLLWSGATLVWNLFWTAFGPIFVVAWQSAVNTVKAIWGLLTAAWQFVWTVIVSVYQVGWAILSGAWSVGWTYLTGSARIAWALLTVAWSVVWAIFRGIWDVFYATFGAVFSGAWNVIVAIAVGVWNVLKAAWFALWAVVTAIFLTFTAVFTGHWGAAWTSIQAAVQAVWNLMRVAWQAFLNVIIVAFRAFVGVLSAAWSAFWSAVQSIASAAWAAFRAFFQTFLSAVRALWTASWNAVRSIFQAVVSAIVAIAQAGWNLIRAGVSAFLTVVQSLWNFQWTAIRTFFNAVVTALEVAAAALWTKLREIFSAGSTWLRVTFWNPVHDFFTKTIPGAFDAATKAVGIAWDKLKKLVRDPIQAIVNVVYNNGIVKLWNAVAGVFGAPKLSSFTLPAFKEGGPTGSGSSRGFTALLHPDEHVWTKDEVKGAGGHKAVAALRSQAMGGARVRTFGGTSFDDGGGFLGTGVGPSVGDIGGAIGDAAGAVGGAIGSAVGKLKDLALGAISGPFGAAVDAMAKGAKGVIRGIIPGDGLPMETFAVGMVDKIADTVKSWVKDNDVAPDVAGGSVAGALTWAKAQAGKPYLWGGVGPTGFDCSGFMGAIQNVIMGTKPNRRVWATGAFGGGVAPSGWKYHEKAPFMVGVTNSGVGHTAGTLNGTNVESRGGTGVVIGSKARGYNNSLFNSWYGFMPSKSAGGSTAGAAQATAKAMLSKYGWNDGQWPALKDLWQKESGWRWNAKNSSSGAYGIPQALPASKMASAGSDWKTSATTQIKWGEGYIKSVYGSPSSALAKWKGRSPHWYNLGTPGAHRGAGIVGETQPEVVSFRGGERIDRLADLVGTGRDEGDTITVTIPISGNADHGVVDRLERETIPKLRMALQQGVGRRR